MPARRPMRPGVKLGVALLGLAGVALVLAPLVTGDRQLAIRLHLTVLPSALLVLVLLLAIRHDRLWRKSSQQLSRVLSEICAGEAPMDELEAFAHAPQPLATLAEQARQLCHEIRSQKRSIRQMEAEMLQRVATRTDTLERKLGALRHKANRDALTGLSNRGAFDTVFPEVVEQARRDGTSLCVVMIDVDYFKPLNDTLGHAAGDDMLRKIGQLIRGAVRDRDEAFRYGGDEFVLVLADTHALAGRALADRLSRLVEDLARPYRLPNPPRLSCGVANLADMPAADPEDLLRFADADLYRVKHLRKSARVA